MNYFATEMASIFTRSVVKVIFLFIYLAGLTTPAPIARNVPREEPNFAESTSQSECKPFDPPDVDERNRNTNEEFHLQQMLLSGFRANSVNRYNISQGGFTSDFDNINVPPPCIPVQYYIDECPNNTHIFIWTVFDAKSKTGNILLKLTVFDLRVFGFELCDPYKDPVEIHIALPDADPDRDCQNKVLRKALTDFTILLPELSGEEPEANRNTTPTAKGYAIQWCEEKYFENYSDKSIAIFIPFLVITSKFLIIAFCYEIYCKLLKHQIHRKTHKWYYIYWAIQILIFVAMIFLIRFAVKHQKNTISRNTFLVSLGIDACLGIVVLIVLWCQKGCCNGCQKTQSGDATQSDDDTFLVPPPLSLFCPYICHWLVLAMTCFQNCYGCRQQKQQMQKNGQQEQEVQQNEQQTQENGQQEQQINGKETDLLLGNKQSLNSGSNEQQTTACSKEQCCTKCWTIMKKLISYCTHFWTLFTNTASLITFIAFLSYLTQALPAIAISYYINPTASLIKLGFFEFAIIILVVEIAFALCLIDKCVWLSYIHWAKKIPDEVYEIEEISEKDPTPPPQNELALAESPQPSRSNEVVSTTSTSRSSRSIQQKKTIKYIEQYLVDGTKPTLISFGHWKCSIKCCHWLLCTSLLQILVAMLLIGMSAPLLYFIMNIVIDQTSTSNDQFKDILAIIPTIALNTWLLVRYGNISHAIKDIMGKATKIAMEHHDSRHGDEHYHNAS